MPTLDITNIKTAAELTDMETLSHAVVLYQQRLALSNCQWELVIFDTTELK